jgi:predicted transcriptional regulator
MRSDIPMVEERRNLEEALRVMQEKRLPAVGITDRAGRLVGLVTPENIGEMMMVQAAHPKRLAGTPWRPGPRRTSI